MKRVRSAFFAVVALLLASLIFLCGFAWGTDGVVTAAEYKDVMTKLIAALLTIDATVLTGFFVWLITNQKELFSRVGGLESRVGILEYAEGKRRPCP